MKTFYSRFVVAAVLTVTISNYCFTQNVGINPSGSAPDNSAMLDIASGDKGLLIPRVSLTSTTDVVTIPSPATSLLVYNTNAAMAGGSLGYWYWDGLVWVLLANGSNNDWHLSGNTGTNPGVNFLGTTDAQDLVIKTNNTEAVRIEDGGNVGIGTSSPAQPLDVHNNFQVASNGDPVLIKSVPYAWPVAQGTNNTVLQNDGAGNLSWANIYGANTQFAEGVTDITTNTGAWTDMPGMSVTFTPKHSTVYIYFTASGDIDVTSAGVQTGFVKTRVTNAAATTVYGKAVNVATDYYAAGGSEIGAWNCAIVCRVTGLTPGVPTTLKAQWATAGYGTPIARCLPITSDYSHRSLFIID